MEGEVIGLMVLVGGLVAVMAFAQKFEGLALRPPMGWNTWNTFGTNIDEKLIRETAEAMIDSGMQEAGYIYVVLDDGWSAKERDEKGNLVPDPERFASGMKALGDWLHARGFKFGIYNCAGTKTCAGYPGGHGYERQDAQLYASWGVDYLKYDWCNTEGMDPKVAYRVMRDALYEAGRPVVFSMCEWGTSRPWEWAKEVAHLWRTTGDITDIFEGKEKWCIGWKTILDMQVGLEKYAGPDGWNDPDMLVVGRPRMSRAENRAHFSLWCMLAAPLMAGNDVRNMSKEVREILTNREVIAVDQDPLGKQGWRLKAEAGREIWVKELAEGNWAVCLFNTASQKAKLELEWEELGFLRGGRFRVRDLWAKEEVGTTERRIECELEGHDVAMFRLIPIR